VPRDDGSVEITFRSHGGIEVRNFVLSWQPHIRVLAPERLRKQVVETMRRGIAANARKPPEKKPRRLKSI